MRIGIRLTPRGRADRIEGIIATAKGDRVLKVSVTAPPAENRANEALLRLLAREWRVPGRALAIVAGATSRDKVVQIAGDPATLLARIGAAIAALPAG